MVHDSEIARRENGRTVIRPGGLRVRWELSDLTTADGHAARASFTCTVKALDDPTERKMLEEVFLARSASVTAQDVVAHFSPEFGAAARREAGSTTAETLLTDAGKAALVARLGEAGRAVAFGCGVEMLPPFETEIDSPTLRRRQEEERLAVSHADRISRAGKLFRQFQEMRASAPELSAGQVLQRIGASDQPDMLRTLLLASAKESGGRSAWAVAGPYLVKLDASKLADGGAPTTRLIPLPPTLGPLRSVQAAEIDGKRVLLVGARAGVLLVDPARPDDATAYADPRVTSALGFNAAVFAGGRLWATHGDAGLVGWDLGKAGAAAPAAVVRPNDAGTQPLSPRNLCAIDRDRVVLSSGNQLLTVDGDGSIRVLDDSRRAEIVGIVRTGDHFVVIYEDGELCQRDGASLTATCQTRRTGNITAAGGLPWLGATRLLLATEEGPVYCVGMDDELVTQYASPYRGLRVAAAAPDLVAAVSSDRQRLVLWPSWDGRKPAAEIHLAGLTKHRVADVDFA